MRKLVRLFMILASFYLAVCLVVAVFQRDLMYHPRTGTPPPASFGLSGMKVETLPTPDGESLELWWSPPMPGAPILLYFHGNAGDLGVRAQRFADFQAAGFGVAALSWRGFGNSTGTPSEQGLLMDAQTAYDWLAARTSPMSIAVIGESLGTGPAVQIAATNQIGALLLGAPYTATVDVAAQSFPILPVRLLMKDRFLSRDYIAQVSAPIHFRHGTADRVIPYAQGQALAAFATAPVTFDTVPDAGHEVTISPATTAAEIAFLRRALP